MWLLFKAAGGVATAETWHKRKRIPGSFEQFVKDEMQRRKEVLEARAAKVKELRKKRSADEIEAKIERGEIKRPREQWRIPPETSKANDEIKTMMGADVYERFIRIFKTNMLENLSGNKVAWARESGNIHHKDTLANQIEQQLINAFISVNWHGGKSQDFFIDHVVTKDIRYPKGPRPRMCRPAIEIKYVAADNYYLAHKPQVEKIELLERQFYQGQKWKPYYAMIRQEVHPRTKAQIQRGEGSVVIYSVDFYHPSR